MIFTDPIADMLTRIRNGLTAHKYEVSIPASKEKLAILNILVKEGYIASCDEKEENVHRIHYFSTSWYLTSIPIPKAATKTNWIEEMARGHKTSSSKAVLGP